MKKSVKKVLGIYSLVMFCSVLLSNALFVSVSEAQTNHSKTVSYGDGDSAVQYSETNGAASVTINKQQFDKLSAEVKSSGVAMPSYTEKDGKYELKSGGNYNADNLSLLAESFQYSEGTGASLQDSIQNLSKMKNSSLGKTLKIPTNPELNYSTDTNASASSNKTPASKAEGAQSEENKSSNSNTNPTVKTQSASKSNSAESSVNGGGAYTAPVGGAYCKNTTNVFETIACKIVTTLDDLRIVIYLIAGFGLIAFAFSAIFGKISWKHLGQLGFGLFLISMMAPFITYFTHPSDDGYKLKYGDYLPAGDFTAEFKKVGVSSVDQTDCEEGGVNTDDSACLKEIVVTEQAPKGSWSLKDLKGTVQSAIKTAQAAHSTLQATKAAVKEVKAQAQVVSGAIKNSGGGINGLMNIAGAVSNAGASLGQVGYTLGNNIQYNVAAAANSYQDSFLTNEQRAYNEKQRAAGNQTNKLATTISDKQSGIVKKGENFYDAKGNKILVKANEQGQFVDASGKVLGDKVDAQGNLVTASKFGNIVTGAEKAREYGMKGSAALSSASNDSQNMNNMVGGVGGSFLGNVAGLVTLGASATGNLVDVNSQIQNNEIAKKQAQATQAASISGVKSSVSDKNGNQTIQYNDGTTEKKNKDGSTSIKFPDGSSQTVNASGMVQASDGKGNTVTVHPDGTVAKSNADGTKETTYKDGSKKEYTKDGGYVAYDKKGNSTGTYDSDGGLVSSAATKASSPNTTTSAAKTTTTSGVSASTSAAPAFKASSAVVTTVKSGTSTITKFEDGSFKEDKANGTSYVSKKDGTGVSYGKDGKATAEYKNGAITAMYLKSGEKAPVTEESGYKVVRNSKGEIQAVYGSSGAAVTQSEAVKAGIKGAESFKY